MLEQKTERTRNTVLALAVLSLTACRAGLPSAAAGADPADASNAPTAWTAPPTPFEGAAFDAA